jgi:hypothetical protein
MENFMTIFTEKASDYKVVDVVLKIWIAGLFAMWVLGMGLILFHLITNPLAIDNASFGVFDTLG